MRKTLHREDGIDSLVGKFRRYELDEHSKVHKHWSNKKKKIMPFNGLEKQHSLERVTRWISQAT